MTTLQDSSSSSSEGRATGFGRLSSSDSSGGGRFVPGTILAERYRIIALLGTGGMGEVYRADDLKLGQAVALKFLPEILAQDAGRIARFFNEVRIARQVSHPNVCRVYDLGESGGAHFLSMEYVDGEDLASLLRRIGRMPPDRAIQIARQLCAGLAAAHAQGILHRDLKPANVMIDGRGRARITDFGLAAAAHDVAPGEIRVGTPAYMAPEQLSGKQVSVKSDLYSMGLVLYELFTGTAPFRADTPAELLRTQQEVPPPSPSSVVDGIDPAVERAILRCLESDPRHRPASVMALAAALPGGDPLAAALAAGETPSPEMVADAGDVGGLKPLTALAYLAGILAGLAILVAISSRTQFINKVNLSRPPEALEVQARELAGKAGATEAPVSAVHGFEYDIDYFRHVSKTDSSPSRWDKVRTARPAPLFYWYRQSPRALVPMNAAGNVTFGNPPATLSGMASVQLDPAGRLIYLQVVPPQRDASSAAGRVGGDAASAAEAMRGVMAGEAIGAGEPVRPVDYGWLFQAAGLDMARFNPVPPIWNPLIDCTERAAWTGEYTEQPGVPIRVEGCSYGARAAWFEVFPPWARANRMEAPHEVGATRLAFGLGIVVVCVVGIAGLFLARRNLRLGRSDRRGALRIAMALFVCQFLYWLLRTSHVSDLGEIGLAIDGLQDSLMIAAMVWLIYVALEPSVRRLWPDVLISWNRLMAGRFTDPLIGRDLLTGGLAGVLVSMGFLMLNLVPGLIGQPATVPQLTALDTLIGTREAMGLWLGSQASALAQPIGVLFLALLLRVLVRRQWLAVSLVVVLFSAFAALIRVELSVGPEGSSIIGPIVVFAVAVVMWTLIMHALIRSGLLACIFLFFIANSVFLFPISPDLTAWYAARSMFSLVIVVALSIYAFVIARTGRTAAWDEMLEARVGGA